MVDTCSRSRFKASLFWLHPVLYSLPFSPIAHFLTLVATAASLSLGRSQVFYSWATAASLQRAPLITSSGRRGRLIGSLGYILAVLGRGTGPRGEKMAGGSQGTDSQDLATILDPFRVIFADFGILGPAPYLRLQHWHSRLAFNIGIQH